MGRRAESSTGTAHEEVKTFLEDNSWRDEVHEFARSVIEGCPLLSGTSTDVRETMRLVTRIYWADPEWREAYAIKDPETDQDRSLSMPVR